MIHKDAYNTIENIRGLKGSKAKTEYTQSLSDNDLVTLKQVIEYTLDPMRSYHITEVEPVSSATTIFDKAPDIRLTEMAELFEYLDHLNDKGSANDADKKSLSTLCAGLPLNGAKLAEIILSGDVRCGIGLKGWQKIFGKEFLPEFPVALIAPFDEGRIEDIFAEHGYAISQLKSDGARSVACCDEFGVILRTRKGRMLHGLDHITNELKGVDGDVDGELVVLDDNGEILQRSIGNGIISKAITNTITPEEASRVRFIVWDYIDRDDVDGLLKMTYEDRLKHISRLVMECEFIELTETKTVYSLVEAKHHFHEMTQRGEEGTILKSPYSLWTPGQSDKCRRANGFKFKEEHEGDFEIIGWYPGKKGSKYEKYIGGFTIQTSCGMIVSDVGSGLTDKMRKADPESYIGKIVECIYNARETSEGRDTESLFLPRVVEVRFDKDTADSRDALIAREEASRQLVS